MGWDDPDADPIADLKSWIELGAKYAAEPKRKATIVLPRGFKQKCEEAGIDVQAELDAGARAYGFTGAIVKEHGDGPVEA